MSRVTFSAAAARAAKDTNLAGVDDDEDLDEEPGEEIESAPPLKVGEEREINSSGLRKKLLKSGCGWETPVSGDEVTGIGTARGIITCEVHYMGRLLDGRQFDSSRDTGETFTFKLGQGHVVSGLNQGILTMKKGEISLFTLPSALAYGDAGTNGIPPGSDIQFEVELISWLSVIDVCKDGGIVKKILSRGDGGQPSDLDEVTVKYQVKLLNGSVVDETSYGGFEFHINQGDELCHLCAALPKVLKTMEKGEKAVVTVQPHCLMILNMGSDVKGWFICMAHYRLLLIIRRFDGTRVTGARGRVTVVDILYNLLADVGYRGIATVVNVFLIVQYDAFGEHGRDAGNGFPMIPPHTVLNIDLELVSFKPVVDITGDMKVVKKVLKAGEGLRRPKDGESVSVRYIAKLEDGTVFEKFGFDGEGPLQFVIDEEQVITGLDQAAARMEKGEISLVTVKPEYGYGNNEVKRHLAAVPASATLIYEVEMIDFVKEKESWELNSREKIETAGKLKETGNSLFKSGKYQRAAKKYDKAIEYISDDESFEYDEQKMSKVLRVSCWLNSTACSLKLKDFQGATKLCSKVLDIESHNVKALFRRAQAYLETADLDLAELDVKKALEIDPHNR
ncbi:hypothetical protein Taro_026118 [Colocasia esculenta]|uniref:peptidylprolyl isomerase n=1 Tax=Colocasia esculenta TaxID=4460 RepID=A0A843VMK3_COLES|nr:hypothetical protein [Colocasia esculenta]